MNTITITITIKRREDNVVVFVSAKQAESLIERIAFYLSYGDRFALVETGHDTAVLLDSKYNNIIELQVLA